jgi:hypothetical protein
MNYKQIEKAIKNNEPFAHNGTMTGEFSRRPDTDELQYRVYSYSTLIYSEGLVTGERWYNDKKYSQTTSRQQSIIKRAKGIS